MNTFLRSLAVGWAAILATGPLPAQVNLPDIGESSGGALSSIDDRLLGEAFLRQIRAHLPLVEDAEITSYITSLGERLARASGDVGRGYRFFVVASPSINAFAGPGGIIAVNTGLITLAEGESELAAVMAHEIAHVSQRHLARRVQDAGEAALPRLAGILAAIVLSTQNAEAGQAALAAVLAGSAQRQINFTRHNEEEADRVGIQILEGAGFDPRAMPTFFERMLTSHRFDARPPEFLSTHPVTVNRIADSRSRAEQFSYRQFSNSEEFYIAKAKIRAATAEDAGALVKIIDEELARGKFESELALRYARAIALARSKRWPEARSAVTWLRQRDPDRIAFITGEAEIEHELGNTPQAVRLLDEALANYPNDTALVKSFARLLLRIDQKPQALRVLEDYGRARAYDSSLYRMLAEAYAGVGRNLESSSALAEYHYQRGSLEAAIRQLTLGLKNFPGQGYAASRAQARLAEFKEELALREGR